MTANVETMIYAGAKPWHHLGVKIPEKVTAQQALQLAKLDWTANLAPILHCGLEVRTHKLVVRSTDNTVLGVVGRDYCPIQNYEVCDVLDSIIGGEPVVETAGSLGGGRRVWFLANLGDTAIAGDPSIIQQYLCAASGHDGSLATTIYFTPVRVVCQNTLNASLRGKGKGKGKTQKLVIKHKRNAQANLAVGKSALKASMDYFARFKALGEALIAKQFRSADYKDLIEYVVPSPHFEKPAVPVSAPAPVAQMAFSLDEIAAETSGREIPTEMIPSRIAQARLRLWELVDHGAGQDGIRGTAWGAWNAVAEYLDHDTKYQPKKDSKWSKEDKRFESIVLGGAVQAAKDSALGRIMETVGL